MIAIDSMMVCLDMSDTDEKLISFTRSICERMPVKKVYFVHNIKFDELSEEFREWFGDVNLENEIDQNISEMLEEQFNNAAEYEVLISEESNTEIILADIVKRYKVKLTLIGKKLSEKSTGALGTKLLRLLPCSMLVVPEQAELNVNKMLVPIDFSDASLHALHLSSALAEQLSIEMDSLHVYKLPTQYFPVISEDKAIKKAEEIVRGKFVELQRKHKEIANVPYNMVRAAGKSTAERIILQLGKDKYGLLVLGLKGSNPIPSLSPGSVPTALYNSDIDVPLWLVYSEDVIK
jgi:nucleotide-binding universal stress UspA family protein